jgi:hypothetical protein
MIPNHVLMRVATDRLHFWQRRLQAAFRDNDRELAGTCENIIAEYALLIDEVRKTLCKPEEAGE